VHTCHRENVDRALIAPNSQSNPLPKAGSLTFEKIGLLILYCFTKMASCGASATQLRSFLSEFQDITFTDRSLVQLTAMKLNQR
jgi:hypothetical protein